MFTLKEKGSFQLLSFATCANKRSACWRNCRRLDCKKQKNAELCFPAELPGVTKGGQHLPPSNDTGNGFECQQPPPGSSPSGRMPHWCLTRNRTLSLQKLPRCTFWQLVSPARCYQLMGRQWRRAPRRSRGGAPPLQRIVESSHGAAGSCHKLLIHHLKLLDHHHYQDHLSPIPSSPGVGLLRSSIDSFKRSRSIIGFSTLIVFNFSWCFLLSWQTHFSK